ncbi:unnamed protein product, partial [Closterium sp. NIES-54]
MCFPPEIKRVPLSSAVTPSANPKSQSDEPLSRPRVSEDFDRAVSQFMAGFQVPAQTQQNSAVSHLVAGLQTHQSAKQNGAAFQQQGANERAVSQVDLLAQLQRRVNLTVTRQQAPSAIRFPSAGINGRSMTFSSTGLNETSALLSAAAPLQSSATIPQCPVSSLPGTPAVSPPSMGIPASITSSRFMSYGTGVTISGVNPFSSNIFSAVSPLRNSMITASSPLSALGINFASSALDSDEGEEKKVRRIMSNRQSAKRSRQRKRERLDELEDEVAALTQAREEANRKLKEAETSVDGLRAANERMEEEVERLRREISSTGRQSQISPQLASPAEVRHPFLVPLRWALQSETRLFLILDFMPGGELFFHLKRERRFKDDRARLYAAELLLALGHLHSLGVIYRDLKPENILLDAQGHVRIADFGLAKEHIADNSSASTFCGTPEYLAPEVLGGKGHGRAVDWWSLGILLFEMVVGVPPFYDRNVNIMYNKIVNAPLVFPITVTNFYLRDLISKLLVREPSLRLGAGPTDAAEIMRHEFFRGMDWDRLYAREVPPPFVPSSK